MLIATNQLIIYQSKCNKYSPEIPLISIPNTIDLASKLQLKRKSKVTNLIKCFYYKELYESFIFALSEKNRGIAIKLCAFSLVNSHAKRTYNMLVFA